MRDYTNYRINKKDIDELSQGLKMILESELVLGNRVSETWRGWPAGGIVVRLASTFKTKDLFLSQEIKYREINDRHYWKAEYIDTKTNDMLLCDFE